MSGGGLALLALFGAAAIALVVWAAAKERKRQARLREFCLSQGWEYAAADSSLVDRWGGPPFGTGDNREARNAIRGPHGRYAMTAFDYSYETESTDSDGNRTTTTHRFAIVSLALPAYLPSLSVTPENVLTRLAGAVGMGDIQLESEDFNRRFRVKSKDAKFASDVLHPRTMERLLAQPTSSWRILGTDIICWETGRISPESILARASLLALVADGVPSFVWRDHGCDQDPLGGSSL